VFLSFVLGSGVIGFLYVRVSLVRSLHPTHIGWLAQENIFAMAIDANRPSPTARRFEAGTPPVVNCYASEAGLKIMLDVGMPAIERRIRALTRSCMEKLREIGWPSVTPAQDERRGAMICVPSKASGPLAQELMRRNIVASNRDDNLRVCFHFYNNEEDVDVLIDTLRELRPKFGI
jgi:selenocysteine lyase/cysteine desulfurase